MAQRALVTNVSLNLLAQRAAPRRPLLVGGRSGGYEKELRTAKGMAVEEMSAEARTLGAHAIVGVDLDYEHIGGGSKSMLMVTASGTAVNLE